MSNDYEQGFQDALREMKARLEAGLVIRFINLPFNDGYDQARRDALAAVNRLRKTAVVKR